MQRIIWSVFLVMLLLPFATHANDELLKLQKDPGQWVMQRKDYAATGYSELSQITAENVKNLKAAWTFSTGVLRGHEGAPLVVGTTMYVHSPFPNTIYALDLTKQPYAVKWSYTPQQNARAVPVACCDTVHRGVNYVEGKIILPTLDGQVIALDANMGKELWKAKNADPSKGETITAAGLVIKDKYIASVSGGENGVRCHVTAYNINTGQQVWRAYSMGPDEDIRLAPDFNAANPHYGQTGLGTQTWPGESWKQGGGCAWGWYSYDPALNLLYYGTGNPGPWNPAPRQGDNKWSLTVFARDPDSGMAKWGYQMTPWDAWDYDGVNESILADLTIDSTLVKALVRFDRNGFTYVLDRTNGTLLSAEPYVFINWATGIDKKTGRPIENPDKRVQQGKDIKYICPNSMGGKDQQPSAYSPKTGVSYVPTNNMCMNKEAYEVKYVAGAPYIGADTLMLPGPGGYLGELIAWDVTTAKKLWGIKEAQPVWSGVLATAGDVIFYGTLEGWFKAVHARTGEVLWKFKTGSGIIGAPITFTGPTDGKQYVAVYSGVGGWYGLPVAANLPPDDPYGALGAVSIAYQSGLNKVTTLGGMLYVFALD